MHPVTVPMHHLSSLPQDTALAKRMYFSKARMPAQHIHPALGTIWRCRSINIYNI